jgi:serine/threonine protein phosphatase 1
MENFIAIGDIHGCPRQLEEILDKACGWKNHKLVFMGDYISRGPDSNGVIDILKEIDGIFLLGNHEDMLFDNLDIIDSSDNRKKILELKNISEKNYEWLTQILKVFLETPAYIFSHAGLDPNKSLSEQAKEDMIWNYHTGEYKHVPDKKIIHGHFRMKEVTIVGNNINVDTGCGLGGYLSGIVLPEMEVIQSKTKSPECDYLNGF